MNAQPEQIEFITDDELARRLQELENRRRDTIRELAAIREVLTPKP